jgi:hypothetical protein
MKSESRVKGYKPGTEDWRAEYNMLLDDGVTCNDCVFVKKCCSIFGQTPYVNEGKCQFYPNRFVKNIKEGVIMTGIERIAAERKIAKDSNGENNIQVFAL